VTDADPTQLLALASEAARVGGELLRERFEAGGKLGVSSKSTPTDLVSEADLASQRAIRELLWAARPDDGFLGEEEGADSVVAGVIHVPMAGETFTALRGGGPPLLNGSEIVGGKPRAERLDEALVATGFAYDSRVRSAQAEVIEGMLASVRDIRRCGAAALDLAWTAAGRFDAFFERTVREWDTAAGALLCECAGLEIHELPERPGLPAGLLAAPPSFAGALLSLVG